MYKLLYPSIRVRTAPPVLVRVRVRQIIVSIFTLSFHYRNIVPHFVNVPPNLLTNRHSISCCETANLALLLCYINIFCRHKSMCNFTLISSHVCRLILNNVYFSVYLFCVFLPLPSKCNSVLVVNSICLGICLSVHRISIKVIDMI